MSRERNVTLDVLKTVAMFFVVMVHSHNVFDYAQTQPSNALIDYLSILANTGVPIFFLISGYLLGSKDFDWKEIIRKKAKTLLGPYLAWTGFYILLEAVGGRIMPASFSDPRKWTWIDWIKSVTGIPFVEPPVYAPLWFIRDLFIANVMAGCLRYILQKGFPASLLIVIFIAVWYLPLGGYFKQPFCFFSLGFLFGFKGMRIIGELSRKKWIDYFGGGCIVLSILLPSGRIFVATKILLEVIAVCIVCKHIRNNTIIDCGKYSFWICAAHGKILSMMQILCVKMIVQTDTVLFAEYIFLPVCVIVICLMAGKIVRNLFPKVYLCLGGR